MALNRDTSIPAPLQDSQNRKKQYKFSTPPWKDTYRKKCIENLRKNRLAFMNKFRGFTECKDNLSSLVEDVMTEEWNKMRESDSKLPSCTELMFSSQDEELTYLNSIFDEIQASLKNEEERLLEIYCQDYEQSLCAAVDELTTESLICPVCQKYTLLFNKHVIFCKCGLRLNVEQDGLGLSDIKKSLDQAREEHDNQCVHTAVYSAVTTFGIDNLLMTCSACDFMYIII